MSKKYFWYAITDSLMLNRAEQEIESLFKIAKEEVFKDGAVSIFSDQLAIIIKKYGSMSVGVLAQRIFDRKINDEISSQILTEMGMMEDAPSYDRRLWLLEKSLFLSSEKVRDSAAVGLSCLDDPAAISILKRAIQKETNEMVKKNMSQVLRQLDVTDNRSTTPD